MKILVIGLGSMGLRRIRLLREMYDEIEIYGIDTNLERQERASEQYGVKICDAIADAVDYKVTYAFICTSPLAHYQLIMECLNYGLDVFSELNVVSQGYDDMILKSKEKQKVLFLSSTFLYRNEIKYIMGRIDESSCNFSYTYHVGQYLPDWHPWEDIKDFL